MSATRLTSPTTHSTGSALRVWIARYPVAAFVIMVYTLVLGSTLPLLLSRQGFGVLPIDLSVQVFQIIASFVGLVLPAFLVTAAIGGRAGVRDLLSRALRWRVGVRWYLFALLAPLAGVLTLALPFFGLVPFQQLVAQWRPLLSVFVPGILLPFVLINLPEELAWMGFLQDHLQERHSPLLASVLTAPAFTLVHLPAFFVDGWLGEEAASLAQLPEVFLMIIVLAGFAVFFRVVLLWLYNATGRSVLLVGLFHSVFNVVSGQELTPRLIGDPSTSNLLAIGAIAALAVIITIVTRGRLGYKEQERSVPTRA